MTETKIEWTEATWNPVTGCSKVSEGCAHCYAERMAARLQAMGVANYRDGFAVRTHENALDLPTTWRKPRMIFVNSMSDLFHEEIPVEFLKRVFDVMRRTPRHTFQILTKRADRLLELDRSGALDWRPNVWMGVTVESAKRLDRIERLRSTGAALKFVSFEPLLGPLGDVDLRGIDWAIVGGESGPGARPMERDWAAAIRDLCVKQNVKFFFKQWGGPIKKRNGRLLDGRTWDEFPDVVRADAERSFWR